MTTSVDALDALRSVLASDGLPGVKFLDSSASPTEELSQAASIQIGNVATFLRSEPTRLMRSRNSPAANPESMSTPSSTPEEFFALDAVVFAVQMASVQGGLYVVQATSRGLARFDAIERPDILAYLTGKRNEWEGVLSIADLQRRQESTVKDELAGPSTTPPSSPPAALKALHNTSLKLPTKRNYVPSKADAAFVKRLRTSGTEIILRTRNDALHGSSPWLKQADFTSFRQSLATTVEAARKAAGAVSSKSASHSIPQSRGPVKKQRALDPIIMLSNSPTSLITMFNVKALLEEGIFVDPAEAKMAAHGQSESIVSVLHRNTNGQQDSQAKPLRFVVVDNAEALGRLGGGGQDVWSRVIAVFTTGQTWQFKAYRWTEPKELFKHVLGVYPRWHNEPRNVATKDWPIQELIIDRFSRHADAKLVSHLWRQIDRRLKSS